MKSKSLTGVSKNSEHDVCKYDHKFLCKILLSF
nr:MAG TPA: hypothetical protein [Caudoviricetes sp.]